MPRYLLIILFLLYAGVASYNMLKIFRLRQQNGSKEQLDNYTLEIKKRYKRIGLYLLVLILFAFIYFLTKFG